MDGLFGLSPEDVRQQQLGTIDQNALGYAQLDPFQKADFSLGRAGGQIGSALGGMLGGVDPKMEEANKVRAILESGVDMETPEGWKDITKKLAAAGLTQQAMRAFKKAREMELDAAKIQHEQAGTFKDMQTGAMAGVDADSKFILQYAKIAAKDPDFQTHEGVAFKKFFDAKLAKFNSSDKASMFGKIAEEMGLQPGTPEFQAKVQELYDKQYGGDKKVSDIAQINIDYTRPG
jgi:hypothetical protein